ncbi:UPF0061 protein AZOSEA38000 [Olea europaea subsp. europaea]|uniref:Selenoprotein O n=1 Tax=Olea europaea subsp. europaea TaxID=158383 RepID=A0A8S0R1B9_OLEEU|nr:UPF0061 protein AZOSEA38000 [Olea europaea subsp. europaea]
MHNAMVDIILECGPVSWGDGRAITLGGVLNSNSESEAMHFLGILTTRALCLVTTGKHVTRDTFYEVAQSFLRLGTYQMHASRGEEDLDVVRTLADYTIHHHFPHLENIGKSDSLSFNTGEEDDSVVDLTANKYSAWAVGVAERTASLLAQWQGVAFTHGVLNTDNMCVLVLSIDYGPFGFLDAFDPSYTPNTTDLPGRRYCFANQLDIGLWNIAQFITTLSAAKMINDKEAKYAMDRYGTKFMDEYQVIMPRKLADPTIQEDGLLIPLNAVLLDIGEEQKDALTSWVQSYIQELSASDTSDEDRKISMNCVNPKYIL